jgi:hypothetical protein
MSATPDEVKALRLAIEEQHMTTNENDFESSEFTPHLIAGLQTLRAGAQAVIAQALARLPIADRKAILLAVDADQCTLTLAVDLPVFGVRVIASSPDWEEPQLLCALEPRPSQSHATDVP